jgi:putative hemolysin
MEILIIFLLILLNGFFSMSEIALVSSKKIRLESAVKAGKQGAATALNLARSPNIFLSTVQVGITLIGLLTGIYSGENITNELEAYLFQFELVRPVADGLAVTIVLLAITFFTLILGELVPKRLGLANPEGISLRVAPVMKLLSRVGYPFIWILTKVTDLFLKIFSIKVKESNITEEEIKAIIHEGTQGGEIMEIEQSIVERVFMLGDRKIRTLMTPRSEIVYLQIDADLGTVRKVVSEDLHRVYPVFNMNTDNVVGIASLKDLFLASHAADFRLRDHVSPPHYLPETTSAYKALEKFKISKVHYALVIDEYGSMVGMVTLDDILQALVGDAAEFSEQGYQIASLDDGSWIIEGQYPFSEFLIHFDITDVDNRDEIITVAGLILEVLRDIPKAGQKLEWKGLTLEVLEMENARISKVRVTREQH